MRHPWWWLESLRTGRLMGLETHRYGRVLPDGAATHAIAAVTCRAGIVLPDRAAGRRGGLRRRTDAVLAAFFLAVLVRAEMGPAPAATTAREARRSLLPDWAGGLALLVLALLHGGLAVLEGASTGETVLVAGAVLVAVAGPALLAGRFLAVRDHRPDDAVTGSWLAPWCGGVLLVAACVVSGGVAAARTDGWWAAVWGALFALLPAAVAVTEVAASHPDDRADRMERRNRRRQVRRHRRERRRWARALARWTRAHARLAGKVTAVTGPAATAGERARLIVHRHAARYGWRPQSAAEGELPGHITLPRPPVPADELRVPLIVLDRLAPDTGFADECTRWLLPGSVHVTSDDHERTSS